MCYYSIKKRSIWGEEGCGGREGEGEKEERQEVVRMLIKISIEW